MAYEKRPGDIAVFKERDKRNERAPDWRGSFLDEQGQEWRVSLWEKGGNGTMLAGKVERAQEQFKRPASEETTIKKFPSKKDDFADDIPF
jgi:hypothetical protein